MKNTQRFLFLTLFFNFHLALIFFVYPEKISESARSGYWLPILLSFGLEFALLALYTAGLRKAKGCDLIDLFMGRSLLAARLVLTPLLLYFMVTICMIAHGHTGVLVSVLLRQTPPWALMLFLGVPLMASMYGVPTIIRTSGVFLLLYMPVLIFSLVSTLDNADWHNLLLEIRVNWGFLKSPSFYASFFAFQGFLYLGLLNDRYPVGNDRKPLLWVFGALSVFYLCSVYIPVLIFGGSMTAQLNYPLIIAMDTVDLEWLIFDRITVFYVVSTLSFVILDLAMLHWCTVKLIQKLYLPASKGSWVGIGLMIVVYLAAVALPGWQIMPKLLQYDTPLRMYCLIGIPLLVYWQSGRKERAMR